MQAALPSQPVCAWWSATALLPPWIPWGCSGSTGPGRTSELSWGYAISAPRREGRQRRESLRQEGMRRRSCLCSLGGNRAGEWQALWSHCGTCKAHLGTTHTWKLLFHIQGKWGQCCFPSEGGWAAKERGFIVKPWPSPCTPPKLIWLWGVWPLLCGGLLTRVVMTLCVALNFAESGVARSEL